MLDVVVIAHGTHESIAQTRLADADLSLVLLRAGEPDHRDVDALRIVTFPRHVYVVRDDTVANVKINFFPSSRTALLKT